MKPPRSAPTTPTVRADAIGSDKLAEFQQQILDGRSVACQISNSGRVASYPPESLAEERPDRRTGSLHRYEAESPYR